MERVKNHSKTQMGLCTVFPWLPELSRSTELRGEHSRCHTSRVLLSPLPVLQGLTMSYLPFSKMGLPFMHSLPGSFPHLLPLAFCKLTHLKCPSLSPHSSAWRAATHPSCFSSGTPTLRSHLCPLRCSFAPLWAQSALCLPLSQHESTCLPVFSTGLDSSLGPQVRGTGHDISINHRH